VRTITGISAELIVEGARDGEPFTGRVIAVAVDDDPPAALSSAPTWYLVADDRRPCPLWVAGADVSAQRLGR
jgi:hypothetical protein